MRSFPPHRRSRRRSLLPSLALTTGLLLAAAPAGAQEAPPVEQDELDAALADRAGTVDERRAMIARTLAHPEVADIAEGMGVDLEQARAAASTLDGARLEQAAALAGAAEQALAGGQVFSMNAVTLIVILLAVVLVVLLVD